MAQGKKLEAVVFDMDGVIIDSEPLWSEAERQLLARRNLTYTEQLKPLLMGLDSREAVRILKKHYDLGEPVEELVHERNQLVSELIQQRGQPIPHALELIQRVRDVGLKTVVASSSPYALVELVVDKLGIGPLLDLVLSGDEVSRGKPAPDIYDTAAKTLGVAPECCLVIEDAPNGVRAAKAAGMRCLAITTGASKTELAAADEVVEDFRGLDLLKLWEEIQQGS
jgi:HAD superfamily hydrolase (TIGR01509 family)